jgi:hypothetical protein
MAQTGRPGLPVEQKRELWVGWKDGHALSDMGRALGKHAGSVLDVLQAKGGIAPPVRKRSCLALTLEEAEEISRGLGRSAAAQPMLMSAVPDHWEGDLLSSGKNTHVATLVEPHSHFLMLAQVDGKDTGSVADALVRQVQQLPQGHWQVV